MVTRVLHGIAHTSSKLAESGAVVVSFEIVSVSSTAAVYELHAHLVVLVVIPSVEISTAGARLLLLHTHLCNYEE